MFRSILVPLDGSVFSEAALPHALELSRRTGADLQLAIVHEPIPSFAYDEWETAAWEWSQEYLRAVRDRVSADAGGKVEAWIGTGRPVEMLRNRAESVGADLVVMATHGRGALSRAWLGSVADAFLRQADTPVLLVRPSDSGKAQEDAAFHRIVVALDGSELAESVLELATGVAKAYGAELHLLRVVSYPIEIASPYLPHTVQMNQRIVEEAKEAAGTYLDEIEARLRSEGVDVHTEVVVDHQAGHTIAAHVNSIEADLVVMATHARKGVQRAILGSTTDKVIRSVHVPVLVRRPA